MNKSRYTEKQFVKILKKVETGRQVKEVYRKYGISDAPIDTMAALFQFMQKIDSTCYSK